MIAVDTNILAYAHREDSPFHQAAFRCVATLALLTESAEHWPTLRALLADGRIAGAQVHDARVAALCRQHGVRELWSADRDFSGHVRQAGGDSRVKLRRHQCSGVGETVV